MVTEEVSKNVVRISELSIESENDSLEATTLSAELLNQVSDQQMLVKQFKK